MLRSLFLSLALLLLGSGVFVLFVFAAIKYEIRFERECPPEFAAVVFISLLFSVIFAASWFTRMFRW